jgi:exodeoxyribonuclease VII small subunit
MTEKKKPQPNFEEAMTRLQSIVTEMEGGELDLDKLIERFEEGQTLAGLCTTKLDEVERRIEKLVKQGSTLTTEPLDAPETADSEPPAPF